MKNKNKIIAGVATSGFLALIGGTKIISNKYKYSKNGYDKDGYNKYGYSKDGFDRYGYNKDGFDFAGNSFNTYAKIADDLSTNHVKIKKYISENQFEEARFLLSSSFKLFYENLYSHANCHTLYYSLDELTKQTIYRNPCTEFSNNEYTEINHADCLIFSNHKLARNQFLFANRILGKLPNILCAKVTDYSSN